MTDTLRDDALEYHRLPTHGKISVVPTKAMVTQRDLSLAYSPGVAEACNEIVRDPREAHTLTARGNLVGVVTNGTAVLGLGNIGPLAGKPVMEGKGCLFKKFAGIDVFDIELAEHDPDKLVDIIAALEPTFGGINLEDIKAPECFYIERKLRERMKIPVFHDDQHGTAIVAAAAVLNGLRCVGKDIGKARLVCSGAGAAAIACLDLLVSLGLYARQRARCRQQGRAARRPHRHGREQTALCAPTGARTLARGDAGCRHLPGAVGTGRADARNGQGDGAEAADPGDGQPDAGDHAGGGARRTARRHYRHRPVRLPEPGQQRAVLPVHLPRRPRCRRHDDQRGDEDRHGARTRRSDSRRDPRRGGQAPTAPKACASAPNT